MSIGDSLLDYFSEEEIQKRKIFAYDNKKFALASNLVKSNIYENIIFNFKNKDSKYIITSIEGHIYFKKNITDCYNKKDKISSDVSDLLPNIYS
jgi:hypothetical protein